MSDEPTERDVEEGVRQLSLDIARDILASDWYAESIAEARSEALEAAALRLERAADTMCAGCDSCDGGSRTAMECAVAFLRGDDA